MFPTTIWTTIREAGDDDPEALEEFAHSYRAPVLRFVLDRGFGTDDAEDVCQEVFLRLMRGGVLKKADRERGRFRSLLLTVTTRTIRDRWRKRTDEPAPDLDPPAAGPDFDRGWVLHLAERALARLRTEGPKQHALLAGHLAGERQDRRKLWLARGKLAALIRHEIALTCASETEFEEELAHLAPFLRPAPAKNRTQKNRDARG